MWWLLLLLASANACEMDGNACKDESFSDNDFYCERIPCAGCEKVVQERTRFASVWTSWSNQDVMSDCESKCKYFVGNRDCEAYYKGTTLRQRTDKAYSYKNCAKRYKKFHSCKPCEGKLSTSTSFSCGTEEKPFRCVEESDDGYKCACEQGPYTSNCLEASSALVVVAVIGLGLFGCLGLYLCYKKRLKI